MNKNSNNKKNFSFGIFMSMADISLVLLFFALIKGNHNIHENREYQYNILPVRTASNTTIDLIIEVQSNGYVRLFSNKERQDVLKNFLKEDMQINAFIEYFIKFINNDTSNIQNIIFSSDGGKFFWYCGSIYFGIREEIEKTKLENLNLIFYMFPPSEQVKISFKLIYIEFTAFLEML